jgi:hypothetical protein
MRNRSLPIGVSLLAAATLVAEVTFVDVANAMHKGRPHPGFSFGQRPPRAGNHYQDHRGDHYQDHRSGDDRNFGGAASSGIRIDCIIFCGHSFTPNGPPHYQDHRNDAPHYQDHRNDGRPPIVDAQGNRVKRKKR